MHGCGVWCVGCLIGGVETWAWVAVQCCADECIVDKMTFSGVRHDGAVTPLCVVE
jgi:hypothetical protein